MPADHATLAPRLGAVWAEDDDLYRLTDVQLVQLFIADRDAGAFQVLVGRHGPRVLRVCRQVLGRSADADDAFQATFLVLARKAGSIRNLVSLGHWLHGVAHRIAVRSRADSVRRRLIESKVSPRLSYPLAEADVEVEDLRRVLHEEIDQLPARVREPILLCYLEGWTNDEAARVIGCPTSTLKERLARGRELLRSRLARRGVMLTPLLLLLLAPGRAQAEEVPANLLRATVSAMKRRPRRWIDFHRGSDNGGPRFLVIAITSATILSLGTAATLAAPTPRRGTWLASLVEAARDVCH
jgi:RNA polymerase sigma factor (sigma-70 family)